MKCLHILLISVTFVGLGLASTKNLIIDTDIFSDVDDAGALLLAATLPDVNLLAVNINYPSSYSAVATSAILAHYGREDVPVGIKRPLNNASYLDRLYYDTGEFASKIAFHWSAGGLPWGYAEEAWDPVALYRKVLTNADDHSVTIASIGFLDNLSDLLNSQPDAYSKLDGRELAKRKVSELVIMGGGYPSGHSWNFWGSDPSYTVHVISTWEGPIVFVADDVGKNVQSGGELMDKGPPSDPVRMAYIYYTYYTSRASWDPLTILYAAYGLGDLFEFRNEYGYNHIERNGSNRWVLDPKITDQYCLRLKASNETAAAEVERRFVQGAKLYATSSGPKAPVRGSTMRYEAR